ncbi:MAG TPA: MFS transporter [Gammaproteobacteria bacterium]|nr:MFS transporter [Gammaproteobacteria bacterium]
MMFRRGTRQVGAAASPPPGRVLAVLFTGVLMGALDIAIVGPALPAIQTDFALGERALSWVFNVYILFNLIGAPVMAKLSDRLGRRRAYSGSIGLFAFGSVVVAAAPSFDIMLAGRAVQAFGAGGIFPVAAAVIGDTFPEARRGRALGLIGAVFGIAFLLGPLLGGILLRFSWHWLFLINVPIALGVLWQAQRVLPSAGQLQVRPFDLAGALCLSTLLAALAFVISTLEPGDLATGLRAPATLMSLAAFIVCAPLFWHIEARSADPILHPSLLRSLELKLIALIALATGLAEAGMVFLPSMAVAGLGVAEATASLMLLPLVATLIVGAPVAGRLVDAVGAKKVIQGGLALCIAGLVVFGLAALELTTFFGAGGLTGLGLAVLLGAPLRYVVIREVPDTQRGAGQGLLTLFLSVGQLSGAALVGGVAASRDGAAAGYQAAMLVIGALMLVALVLSTRLRNVVDRAAT